VKFSQLVINCT